MSRDTAGMSRVGAGTAGMNRPIVYVAYRMGSELISAFIASMLSSGRTL